MENTSIETIHIVGIAKRTTNENQQAAKDIPLLWEKFISEDIANKISKKTNDNIYAIYSDYESDHTKPYTIYIGCPVESLDNIPENMVSKTIFKGNYTKFIAKGDYKQGSVYNEWMKIWNTPLDRKYTTDFEVYSEKSKDLAKAEVPIYISIK
ncbi:MULTISPECIES: GyrI-like domain-containing protein [Flavobacterium]|uniref:GyrI-like domain-containing protein n=1 Tax=Flavobacterium jumunjinense TaxID=998845 RepID=A0ABV5GRY7_9FLAO|nr:MULTISPECIES: GyrI-like domain-containing protein [Flavobacterium]